MYEDGIYAQGETPSAEDMAFVLSKLNRMLDTWNASKLYIYAVNFAQYAMIPTKNPQTIGKAFKVTSVSLTTNVATFTGIPTRTGLNPGDSVTTVGITGSFFNVTAQNVQTVAADGTSFTLAITHADVGLTPSSGVVIPANQPATSAPDFAIPTSRPVKIVNANIILNNTATPVRVPMRVVDSDWWANQRVPTIQTTLPTHLYYQADWPNGSLFFWPVPQVAYPVELETWINLAQLAADDTFTLPPGYEDAVTYTLAETICPAFSKPVDQTLAVLAMKARSIIQGLNSAAPLITTADFGMPGTRDGRGRSDWNWKTGSLTG
jgi:hypothetical protein